MAIVESRLRDGTLTIGTAPDDLDLSCQLTNVRYAASYTDDGDAVETLCGDKIAAAEKNDGGSLQGTFIQDWTAATGTSIILYLMDHDLEEVDYTYTPNPDGATFSGKVRIKLPGEFLGGDVNTRISSDFEWTVVSWPPTITPPVVGTTGTTGTSPPATTAAA
jgi:hypothetical protein